MFRPVPSSFLYLFPQFIEITVARLTCIFPGFSKTSFNSVLNMFLNDEKLKTGPLLFRVKLVVFKSGFSLRNSHHIWRMDTFESKYFLALCDLLASYEQIKFVTMFFSQGAEIFWPLWSGSTEGLSRWIKIQQHSYLVFWQSVAFSKCCPTHLSQRWNGISHPPISSHGYSNIHELGKEVILLIIWLLINRVSLSSYDNSCLECTSPQKATTVICISESSNFLP